MTYTVAVRALCAFTARRGDLDLRFLPAPSAQEGIAGHALVQSRRPAGYEAEISLSGDYRELHVRGRADGYDPALHRLEEIKTHRGDLDLIPDNHRHLHWAQAKMYGHLLCVERGFGELQLALVYLDIGTQKETVLTETHTADALRAFFEEQCGCFLAWAQKEMAHRAARNAALGGLRFPYPGFRSGQRPLAEAVYTSAGTARPLLAQAPTGIGKTVGTLFPMLKACPAKRLDKVFFLTAKTSGRRTALDAMAAIQRNDPLPIRVLELVARDKACEHPDKACHGQSCPLARGFYDRLPQARAAALDAAWDRDGVRRVALAHEVCPYYLAQDLARWADVVVADYNYYFDASALLFALTVESSWRVGVLADEAHNLVARTREMYSATLGQGVLDAVRRTAPPPLKPALARLHRAWNEVHEDQENAYQVHPEVPAKFDGALRNMLSSANDYFAQHPAAVDGELQRFYFDALQFSRLIDTFGAHALFDVTRERQGAADVRSTLCVRNVIPAPHLAPRFAAAACTVLFSATLSPWYFYADMLGLDDPAWIDVESPFHPDQLTVSVARDISTRFQERARSIGPIVDLVAAQYGKQPGNYLAFFSSFDYLEQVHSAFAASRPEIPAWRQSRNMTEAERDAFLSRFEAGGRGIGFAVLGGAFAEGIDLPGDRLIGAFIATLGMPQVNPVNQEMMRRMDALLGNGHAYTYQYPGLQKVVQAAGRVIRTVTDRGTVHLMDDRFGRAEVRALLPRWWHIGHASVSRGTPGDARLRP